MANKIVDLDRLKDYASKESVLLGKKVKDAVLFDGTVTLTAQGSNAAGEIGENLELRPDETYKVTLNGTEYTIVCEEDDYGNRLLDNAALNLDYSYLTVKGSTATSATLKVVGTTYVRGAITTLPNSNVHDGEAPYAIAQESTEASAPYANSFGWATFATGTAAHSEGYYTVASSDFAHSEGGQTQARGKYSHAENVATLASGQGAHAEGQQAQATGNLSHAEGYQTVASKMAAHAEGAGTKAASNYQHVQGTFNVADSASKYADIVGWGSNDSTRKNIEVTTVTGDKILKGNVYVRANDDSTGGVNICDTVKVTKAELNQLITDKKLIPGLLYQITDYTYVAPTGATLVSSANKPFDIVLTATAKDKFVPEASALLHTGDTTLSSRNLSKWKLTYDVATHTITSLTDENNCTAPYDHINVLFKRWATTDAATGGTLTGYYAYLSSAYAGEPVNAAKPWIYGGKLTIGTGTQSVNTFGANNKDIVVGNGGSWQTDNLPNVTFGDGCHDIEVAGQCYSMVFGASCSNINIGQGCNSIIFGGGCANIDLAGFDFNMIIRNGCNNLTFGKLCRANVIGPSVGYCDFGTGCLANEVYGDGTNNPTNNSFVGGNTNMHLFGNVKFNTFLQRAGSVWIDTSMTTPEEDASTDAALQNWFKWTTFESGTALGKGKSDGTLGGVFNFNSNEFVNSKHGTKRTRLQINSAGIEELVCYWYEGLTIHGMLGKLQQNATVPDWTAL